MQQKPQEISLSAEDADDIQEIHAEEQPDDQEWFWTAEWQEGEKEATSEIQSGQLSRPLRSVEEIRQYLSEL